jgi:predicted secreted protein
VVDGIFMVLPFGVCPACEAGGVIVAGQAATAPAKPRITTKRLVTTLILGLIMGAIVALIEAELIDFRDHLMLPGSFWPYRHGPAMGLRSLHTTRQAAFLSSLSGLTRQSRQQTLAYAALDSRVSASLRPRVT